MATVQKKNYDKRTSYALAFRMIDDALRFGCPLQAIAIEESILTDRLSSTLNAGVENSKPYGSLGGVLNTWKPKDPKAKAHPNARLFDQDMDALYPRLDAWRNERNGLLHGLAKSIQGKGPDINADDFVIRAIKAANEGLTLVKKVKNWVQKQVRNARKGCGK